MEEGDTLVVQESGVFLTDAQFQDMAAAVDSLDFWRQVARLEEKQKARWKGLYVKLDSLYKERDELPEKQGSSLGDKAFWGVLGAALQTSVNELLEN